MKTILLLLLSVAALAADGQTNSTPIPPQPAAKTKRVAAATALNQDPAWKQANNDLTQANSELSKNRYLQTQARDRIDLKKKLKQPFSSDEFELKALQTEATRIVKRIDIAKLKRLEAQERFEKAAAKNPAK